MFHPLTLVLCLKEILQHLDLPFRCSSRNITGKRLYIEMAPGQCYRCLPPSCLGHHDICRHVIGYVGVLVFYGVEIQIRTLFQC